MGGDRPKGTKKVPISDEELRSGAPLEVVRNVLPKQLANELLELLLAEVPTWQRGQWIMFGKTHDAPRTSCYYSLACGQVRVLHYFPFSCHAGLSTAETASVKAQM